MVTTDIDGKRARANCHSPFNQGSTPHWTKTGAVLIKHLPSILCMKKKFLIDTAIWIDLYEDRVGYQNEPLGDYALKLLARIQAAKETIVLTDFLMRELESRYSLAQINGMFKPFGTLVQRVMVNPSQMQEAKKVSIERNVPRGDALHAIIARDEGCILITRDNHFSKLMDLSPFFRPEDLI